MQYKIGEQTLHLRDKATFWQVKAIMALATELEIGEDASPIEIIRKASNRIDDVMPIIFDLEQEALKKIKWDDVEFDTVVEIFEAFFGSSVQLRKMLNGLMTIFHKLESLLSEMSPGPGDMAGTAFSTAPPADVGAKQKE